MAPCKIKLSATLNPLYAKTIFPRRRLFGCTELSTMCLSDALLPHTIDMKLITPCGGILNVYVLWCLCNDYIMTTYMYMNGTLQADLKAIQ